MTSQVTRIAVCLALGACATPSHRTENVYFQNGSVTLSGTLYVPNGQSAHPAIVIVHGSGSQTRAPYAQLARLFSEHGIAALIYDKRGTGSSDGDWRTSPFVALADDAAAAIAYLRLRPDIVPTRVGIWGGSEGGWVAPWVAARDSQVAFVIVQSAPGITPAEQHLFQVERLIRAHGGSAHDIERARAYVRAQHVYAETRQGWSDYARLRQENRSTILAVLGGPSSPNDWWWSWWRSKMAFDPIETWASVRVPVFALWGDHDDLVPAEASLAALETALLRGNNRDYHLEIVRNATHDLEPRGVIRLVTIAERLLRDEPGVTPSMKRMARWARRRFWSERLR